MKKATNVLVGLIALCLPFFLGFTTIHMVIGPTFLRWEYNKLDFPADPYGLTQEQRLELSRPAVEYLSSWGDPEEMSTILEEQILDGEPLYNQREIDHVIDTKKRTDILRLVAIVTGVIVAGGVAWLARREETRSAALQALTRGAYVTAGILGAICAYILIGWDSFFTRFHELLFPPGTWRFGYDEGLIRLFPEKFWFDVGVTIGVGTLLEAVLIWGLAYWLGRRTRHKKSA